MKEINLLPPSVFNLLAAGEVVENPASIVKETVENSLDAGARAIEVSIAEGGLAEITIVDNGHGVDSSQAEKVFMPHATSKVAAAHDLDRISTLGFRGEALSSIASVSRIEFISKTDAASLAVKLELDGGTVTNKTNTSANVGTQISIKNLFYNTPARKKFLQSARLEQNNVTNTVQKLILANPEIGFKYIADGEIVYDYKGKKLLDAIELIYGKETAESIIPISASAKALTLEGFISKPSFTKKNRTYQTVMINGRTIEGGTVALASNNAFSTYMTVGNFPFFVLNLKVDTESVDVNVHPRKAQVRFSSDGEISLFVKDAVVNCLDKYFHNRTADFMLEQPQILAKSDNSLTKALPSSAERKEERIAPKIFDAVNNDDEIFKSIKYFSSSRPTSDTSMGVRSAPNILNIFDKFQEEKASAAAALQSVSSTPRKAEQIQIAQSLDPKFDVNILGTIFDTYILFKSGDLFYILDQHAAHERLLYDKLRAQIDSGTVATQALIEPCMLMLSPPEMSAMIAAEPHLNKMGFECAPFGGSTFRITAVPVGVPERGIDTVVTNLLKDIRSVPPSSLSALLGDKVITECCKAAIKAGHSLNNAQIGSFLNQFRRTNITPTCPHGRPIFVSFSRDKIEKLFARK